MKSKILSPKLFFSFLVATLFSFTISAQTLPDLNDIQWKSVKEAKEALVEQQSKVIISSSTATASLSNYNEYFGQIMKLIDKHLSGDLETRLSLENAVSETSTLFNNLGINEDEATVGFISLIEILKI